MRRSRTIWAPELGCRTTGVTSVRSISSGRSHSISKRRPIAGRIAGGAPFTYGPLAYLLKSRTYLGETGHGGEWFPGEHEPVIDRTTFDAVQELLRTNSEGRAGRRQQTGALLTGLIYDDRGNRMSPSYSVKNGIRYPFYVSSSLLKGRKHQSGSVARISATAIEQAVLLALRNKTCDDVSFTGLTPREFAERTVERIVVRSDRLTVTLHPDLSTDSLEIPWSAGSSSDATGIEGDAGDSRKPDEALVQAVARAHVWLDLLSAGTHESIEELATAAGVHPKVIRNRIRLAFLSPRFTLAILSGEQSTNASLAELNGPISLSWHRQGNKLHGPD